MTVSRDADRAIASALQREKQLFLDALDVPAAERGAWLAARCGGEPELRRRLERLLGAHEAAPVIGRAPTAPMPATAGASLAETRLGDYELLDRIASGGMGVVYRARQPGLDRLVAVKVIRAGRFAGDAEVRRFRAEAETVARLDHPHIVPIYEVGEADGHHFFSMKLVDGADLTSHLDALRRSPERLATLLVTVARAVHHGHQRGVLHRDLKPSNILIDRAGTPYVTDFGIAKLVDVDATTHTAGVLGTPSYMAPEQATSGAEVTTASDVYGLGSILYALLTGRAPYEGDSPLDILLRKTRDEAPPRPRSVDPAVDRDLETICLKCLAKEPARRYPSTAALADDLERWLDHRPIAARPVSAVERMVLWARRKPLVAGLTGAVVLLALALVAGSAVSSARLRRNLERAVAAEEQARERLRASYVAQAEAVRSVRKPGRRFQSLDLLRRAAAIGDGPEIRDGLIASLALTDARRRHSWAIDGATCYGLNPDHALYYRGGADGRVRLYRVETDELVAELDAGPKPLRVSFDDRSRLVAVQSGTSPEADRFSLSIWEVSTGRLRHRFPSVNHDERLTPDGRHLIGVTLDRSRLVARALDGTERWRLDGAPQVWIWATSHDGRWVAVSHTTGQLDIVDQTDGRAVRRLDGYPMARHLAWSADGRRLAIGGTDFHGYIVDLASPSTVRLTGHTAEVVRVSFSPDARLLLTQSWDGSSRLWDAHTGRDLLTFELRMQELSRTGSTASFADHTHFGVYEVAHGDYVRTLYEHIEKSPHALAVSPDQRYLASAGSDGVVLWELATGDELGWIARGQIWSVEFHPDGDRLLASGRSGLRMWRFDPGDPMADPREHSILDVQAERMSLSRDGRTVAVIIDAAVTVLDLEANTTTFRADAPALIPSGPSLSPDGCYVAVGSWAYGGGVRVWDVTTGEELRHLMPDDPRVNARFSADGRYLVTGSRTRYRVWRVGSWQHVVDIERPGYNTQGGTLSFGAGGQLALAARAREIALADIETGTVLANLRSPGRYSVGALALTADGDRLIAARSANQIQIWELGKLRRALRDFGASDRALRGR